MTDLQSAIGKRRGFNLLEMFSTRFVREFSEDDFRWIADWGFDFVRIPINYLAWVDKDDPFLMREQDLARLDRAVDLARKHRIHINLNFHRAPGYCSNDHMKNPMNLWKEQRPLDAFCRHWEVFARRYQSVSYDELSFNLINEPTPITEGYMSRADHERVVRAAVAAIRAIDPGRPIVADGISYGTEPCPELADLGLAQSCRAYVPLGISHYKAGWTTMSEFPEPTWPGGAHVDGRSWDRSTLEEHYAPWIALKKQGVAVQCGEGGAINNTPHRVALAWYRDVLEILTDAGIGTVMWNLRGSFGVLDSGRADVDYEDWYGHKLDRKLLELVQEFKVP